MRRILRNGAMVLLAAGAAGAVLSQVSAQNSRQTTLVYGGDWTDLITLDPGAVYEFSAGLVVDNAYETLVKFEGEDLSTLKPSLATEWDIKDAGDSWKATFKLRTGQKFSSGNPVTAEDVVYSVERVLALKTNSSFLYTDVANIKPGTTKAVNATTVEFTLPKTASPQSFLSLLTFNVAGIVDSVEVKKHVTNNDFGTGWLKTNSAGSGPFVIKQWDQGQQVILDVNPNARLKSKLARIVLKNIQESNAQKIAIESGEIDIAENLSPEMVRDKQKDSKFIVYKADSSRLQYIGMNSGKDSLFADARVRQAVRYAIDQDSIVKDLAGGFAKKIQTIIPFGLLGANPATPYKVDIEKAKALLAAAGKPNGFEFEFQIPTGVCGAGIPCADLGAKVQADLAKIGLKANIKQIAQSEGLKIYRAQKGQMVLFQWSPDFADPDGNGTPMADYNAKSLAWRNDWNSPAASKLAQQAALETNTPKRVALYKQLTELVLNDGPFAILFQPSVPLTLSNKVENYVRNAQGQVRFEIVSKKP
jgi:peptide/nickel transport system substrate-binding protein